MGAIVCPTVLANDSTYLLNSSMAVKTNLNNTERIQITIDRTAPSSVTIANTTSTTTTSVVATITAVDATSGINNCVADTSSGVVITGTGTGNIATMGAFSDFTTTNGH